MVNSMVVLSLPASLPVSMAVTTAWLCLCVVSGVSVMHCQSNDYVCCGISMWLLLLSPFSFCHPNRGNDDGGSSSSSSGGRVVSDVFISHLITAAAAIITVIIIEEKYALGRTPPLEKGSSVSAVSLPAV